MFLSHTAGLVASLVLVGWSGTGLTDPPQNAPQRVGPQFDQWDVNKDGVVDRQEFELGVSAFRRHAGGPGPTENATGPSPSGGPLGRAGGAMNRRLRDLVTAAVQRAVADETPQVQQKVMDAVQRELQTLDVRGGRHRGGPPQGVGHNKGANPNARRGLGPAPQSDSTVSPSDATPQAQADQGVGRSGREIGRRFFDRFDANKDGVVTQDEFKGDPERFEALDRNQDGRIDREELRQGMQERLKKFRAKQPGDAASAGDATDL